MGLFLNEINISIGRLIKIDCSFQCRWASSNSLRAWIEQKCRERENFFLYPIVELRHWSLLPLDWVLYQLPWVYRLQTADWSDQIRSVAQSCLTLCDPMNRSMPGLPVQHQHLELTETRLHWVSDAIQPSNPLSSPSPPAPNPSQHQSLFQWVNFSHEMAKVLEFQL